MDRQTEMKKSSEAKLIASQGAVIHLLIGDGHPEEGGSIQPKGGKRQRYLSYWHHQFNLLEGLDEFL